MNGFNTTVVVLLLAILAIQLYETFGKKENYSPYLSEEDSDRDRDRDIGRDMDRDREWDMDRYRYRYRFRDPRA